MRWNELKEIYQGKKVLITGHTGFKGSWLSVLLIELGAEVVGYSLDVKSQSNFESLSLSKKMYHCIGDIRDAKTFTSFVQETKPQMVFHLAAQSLVSQGYEDPLGTIQTNVMGTVNVLELYRSHPLWALLVITSDKCYRPTLETCEENSPLGGDDPYSASKASTELIVHAYRSVFPSLSLATARAGNSIGAGDTASDRLFPDILRSIKEGVPVKLRNPKALRPWQYVLEPLWGYLILGAQLLEGKHQGSWNFGPAQSVSVQDFVEECIRVWQSKTIVESAQKSRKENQMLSITSNKAKRLLGWSCKLSWKECIQWTVDDVRHLEQQEAYLYISNRIRQYAEYWECR